MTSPKKGQPEHNPCAKFDLTFKALIENINHIAERADLDECGDKNRQAFSGHGERGTRAVSRKVGKPGINKGHLVF